MARIYVSSTFKDLEECREKVSLHLRQVGHEDIAMEYYVAQDKRPVDKCLKDVTSCDLYIGIFVWRYGYLPDGYDKSITELEYRKAVEEGKDCLIFLLNENAPSWPPKYVDIGKDAEKIRTLRNELSTKCMVSFFKSADELASLVGAAVHNWENERRIETPTADQETMSRYNPSTLPYYPERLKKFVTENRADELRKALTYLEKHRILLLSGVGGVGKSTLARALVNLGPTNVPEPFWFSFYDNQDAKLSDILEKLAAYMNAPEIVSFKAERREPGKIDVDKLTDELHRRRKVWLIFDDLSMMLEDQQFVDKGIELLFSSLRFNTHNAKVIITSRILPILKNGESLFDVVEGEKKQQVEGLEKAFAVDFLASNELDNIEHQKLEKLATGVDGHPLALKLLVELVKEYGVTDILEDLRIYQKQKMDTIIKARKLFDKVAGAEKEFLERISVYREPVSMKGLKEMFTENTPENTVKKLIDKSLLETYHNGNYWLHPLVQEFSYEDLKNKKEVHLIAYNYYKSLNLLENPTRKEDLQPAIEAHYHACEAGEYDLAADIIWEFNLHNLLDLWGNPGSLIEIYEKILPKDHFKGEPILEGKQAHGAVLGNLGLAYSDLGETKKAIEYHEQALKTQREIGNRSGEGAVLGNLGLAYSDLDEPKKAIEYYEQALKIQREIGDRRNEGNQLGNLGNMYFYLGKTGKAIEYHKQILTIHREIGDRRGEGADLMNLGLAYSELGETKKAIEYHEQALKIDREIGNRRGEGAALGNLGLAYSDLGETRKEIEYYEKALKIAREIGNRSGEGDQLGNLGSAYSNLGEKIEAIEYYEQALKIAREINNRRGEGTVLGNLGLAYTELGETRKAVEFLNQSLTIGNAIEDLRIISFCEQILKELEKSENNESSNNTPASNNILKSIFSKLKSKK